MRPVSYLVQPVKVYFIAFLLVGVLFLLLLVGKLYHDSLTVQEVMQDKAQKQAQEELDLKLEETLINLTSRILDLSDWDELRQQINDPIYYYYWYEDRLKESPYYKATYAQLEIYNQNRWLLMPPLLEKEAEIDLPLQIMDVTSKVVFSTEKQPYLHIFEPVFERDSESLLGYIGVSVELIPYLLSENDFKYVNPQTITLLGSEPISLSELPSQLSFEPVKNTVSSTLWQLINDFILQVILLLLFATVFMGLTFQTLFSRPIQTLSKYLHKLKQNPEETFHEPSETFFLREFEELKHSMHIYHRDLQAAQKALNTQYQIVWDQARRDVLTNIHNRRAFDEAWNKLLTTYEQQPQQVAFILFDCDFFKALNDTYGHEIGDDVIRISAKTIQEALPLEYPVFRIGGDEFAVIIQNKTLEQSISIAQICLHALQNYNFIGIGIKEKLSFSIGISHIDPNKKNSLSNNIANLPRQADIAMYKAKQSHQHKIQCYQTQFEQESLSLVSNEIISTIIEAIHTGHNMKMHYQAIQSVSDGALYYEALIRIQNGNDLIYPNDIFSVVERRRLEVEIDTQIIQQILIAFSENKIPTGTGVSINVSGKTLLQPNFIGLFEAFIPYLKDYKIVIEIIENTLIDHMEYAKSVLNELRKQGFLIALDDFGSGYSSIRYLAQMPVDIIKFDMSMTRALQADEKTKNIIQSTAEMVRRSGYDLVLEGIEDTDLLEKAKQAGATHIQGYLLGKPNPVPHISNPMQPCQSP